MWIENIEQYNDYSLEVSGLSMIATDIDTMKRLSEECFFYDITKRIFRAMKEARSTDVAILSQITWINDEEIYPLMNVVISYGSFDYIVNKLNDLKTARILKKELRNISNNLLDGDISGVKKELQTLHDSISHEKEYKSLWSQLESYMEDMYKEHRYIKTWYREIDKYLLLSQWKLATIAWRPWMGKTTVMQNIALRQSFNHNVGFVSMEMWVNEIIDRFVCMIGDISSYDVAEKLKNSTRIMSVLWDLIDKKLFLVDDIYKIEEIDEFIARNFLDVCFLDHLSLILHWESKMPTIQRISEITRILKVIAKKRNCLIILWSQLSRETEKRVDKRPQLSDLRDSWTIEQDSDAVIMLYREEYYDKQTENKNCLDAIIAKNRGGISKDIQLWCKFSSYQVLDNKYFEDILNW